MLKTIALACAAACIAAPAFAASLSTGFAGGNGLDGNVFDIQIGASDITVSALEVNLFTGASNLELYYRLGGYAGNIGSLAGWTLWDSVAALPSNGANVASAWDVVDQSFAAGQTYGIYVTTTDNNNLSYTNGTVEGAVLASDAGLTIFEGRGVEYPFGFNAAPRNWNGTIIYSVTADVPLPAALPLALAGFGALAALGRRRRG